jgi:hypothetical protein
MNAIDNHLHKYQELDRVKNEIRVLQLLTGTNDDPVVGELRIIELDANLAYCALSYMWGDPKVKTVIEVDQNKQFSVTKNAEAALRDIRNAHGAVLIWIDAICINQGNIDERNHQVKLMQQIYLNAQLVFVWLNISLQASHKAFQLMEAFNDNDTLFELGDDASLWEPVATIGNDVYWTRVWIQQEVAFAHKLVIQCQNHTVNGESLLQFQHLVRAKHMATRVDINSKWSSLETHYMDLSGINRNRPGENRDDSSGYRYQNIIEALSHCGHLSSTDPRDRVYAILSLVEGDILSTFPIDYHCSVVEVYTRVVKYVLETHNSVAFLAKTYKGYRTHALPSWVPDWSCPSTSFQAVSASRQVMSCSSGQASQYFASISNDLSQLTIYGTRIGALSGIYPRTSSQDISDTLQDWACQLKHPGIIPAKEQKEEILSESFDQVPEKRWKSFLRTMLRAETASEREDAEGYVEAFRSILPAAIKIYRSAQMDITEAIPKNILGLWLVLVDLLTVSALGNYFSFTKTGQFVLAPPEALPEDEIWATLQCPTPILLRPFSGYFEVIGPCHIDDEHIFQDLLDGLGDEVKYPLADIKLR